mgnify:CR=1 FL=1
MNKIFLQKLVTKPNTYLLVWGYIFSRLDDDNKGVIYLYEISVKYKLPKSTLKRIVSFGVSLSGFKMDCKWISNSLHIKVLDYVDKDPLNIKMVSLLVQKVRKEHSSIQKVLKKILINANKNFGNITILKIKVFVKNVLHKIIA